MVLYVQPTKQKTENETSFSKRYESINSVNRKIAMPLYSAVRTTVVTGITDKDDTTIYHDHTHIACKLHDTPDTRNPHNKAMIADV